MSDLLIITSYRWSTIATTKWASTAPSMGLNAKTYTIIPFIPFAPSARFYTLEELSAYRDTLMEEIQKLSPKAILMMGDHAFGTLTGNYGGKRALKYMRGFCLPTFAGVPGIGTFDLETFSKSENRIFPQQSKLLGLVMLDISSCYSVIQGRLAPCVDPSTEVRVHTGTAALAELLKTVQANPDALLSYDLETSKSALEDEDELYEFSRDEDPTPTEEEPEEEPSEWATGELDTQKAAITTVQFALNDSEGWTVEWNSETVPLIKALFKTPNAKVGHNTWLFDNPILIRHGVTLEGTLHDTLWLWHSIQPDLPAHLQGVAQVYGWTFPWKHMSGTHFEFYGVVDVCAVHRIMSKLPKDAERLVASNGANAWQGYDNFTRRFHTILQAVERRGIPVNRDNLNSFRTWLMDQVTKFGQDLQPLIPTHLGSHVPPDGYAKLPEDIREGILAHRSDLFAPTIKINKNGSTREIKSKLKWSDVYKSIQEGLEDWTPEVTEALKLGYIQLPNGRFARKLQWNPRSTDQLKSYIAYKGYPMPTRFKDGKATTGDKELEKLATKTGDPVIKLAREYRAHSKMINAYTGTLQEDGSIVGGWNPGPDGRLRTTFTFGPATWQLGARNPNVLTTPKRRAELAKRFRECIKADPGHKLVECVTPDTLILCKDLTWKAAGDLNIGDSLWGFDETQVTVPESKRPGRYIRESKILNKRYLTKPSVTIDTDLGSISCSTDHLFLVRRNGRATWVEAKDIRPGNSICFFTKPWPIEDTRDSGWLAGFMDGEGYCNGVHSRGIGFGQNPGIVLDKAKSLITQYGFDCMPDKQNRLCEKYRIGGHQFGWLRFLGMIRPIRLLEKALSRMEGMAYWGKKSRSAIVSSVESIGEQTVVAIETSTKTFIANGMLSHNCDFRAFHARTLGLEAKDATYMRIADLDIHSFVTGHLVKWKGIETALDLSDDDLRAFLGEIKKVHKSIRDFKAKPTILGVGFGMGYRRLYFENRESFESESEAKRLLDLLKSLFPKVFAWQESICQEADRRKMLISRWGAVRRFHEVFRWEKTLTGWKPKGGKDAEKAKAFLPANDAHGMLRFKLLELDSLGYLDKWQLINIIHDAVLFHPPNEYVEECMHLSKEILEAPVAVLADPEICPEGFTCAVEASVGEDWATMKGN